MEKKNKGLAFVLAAVLSLSLAACGDKKPAESEEKEKETTTTTAAAEESKPEETTAPAETTAPEDEIVTADETAELEPEETPTEEETKSAVLEEAGKFDAENVGFYNDIIYKGTSEEDIECLNYMGEVIDGGDVPMVSKLGDTGLYCFCKKGEDIVYTGLMDEEGNVIVGADQGVGTYSEIDDRFLTAYFPEGETKDKKEAIYYVTANQFSFKPNDEDILYKGTVKVFDTKTGKFLENTAQKIDPHYSVDGDVISFYDADDNLVYVNADDKVIESGDFTPEGIFFTKYEDGKTGVYDHELNKLLTTDYSVYALDNTDYYYRVRDNETVLDGIMSAKGRVLIDPKYKNIMGIDDTYFSYSTDTLCGLAKYDGTELTKDIYGYVSKVAPGYFTAKCDDNKIALLDKTGKEIVKESDDISLYALDEAIYITKGDEYLYLVYNDNDFTLKLPTSGTYLGSYLLYSAKDKAIYDIITGEKVLEDIDKAYAAYGHVYVLNGDEYTVYDIK